MIFAISKEVVYLSIGKHRPITQSAFFEIANMITVAVVLRKIRLTLTNCCTKQNPFRLIILTAHQHLSSFLFPF